MNTKKFLISLGLTLSALLLQSRANAATFNFNLDSTFDDTLSGPFIGSGSLTYTGNFADGTYLLTDLPDFDVVFTIGADTFTNANIITPLSTIQVIISGGGTQLNFSNINSSGIGGYGGSIDFTNNANAIYTALSLEPPGFSPASSPLSRYFVDGATQIGGNYTNPSATYVPPGGGTPVPAPPSVLGLAFLGGSALLAQSKRRKADITASTTQEKPSESVNALV